VEIASAVARRWGLATLLTCLAGVAFAGPASAARIEVKDGTFTYTAAPLERSDLQVYDQGDYLSIHDTAPLDAPDCVVEWPGSWGTYMRCPDADRVVLHLGDGDDQAQVGPAGTGESDLTVEGEGGEGDDDRDSTHGRCPR
jgi:hypothetical protein